ncbi:hypothetical protein [Pseudomonas fulva]|uniref:hypothetical protein n=1 Tax=Pseudomonas fulva TaxID=47880 RepID=UPI0018AA3974|nr:hypothetical protein [Pseudomonas fulva]MBF8777012.1 hypothetical protein [Pseudomonas fulva]
MRISLDGLGQAVDGDRTTTGGICIATGEGYLDEGRVVLQGGEQVGELIYESHYD